jgi:asparagine synthetase B (glutamine-hydrolysing)
LNTKILNTNQGWFAVSFHKNAPLKGTKYFEDKEWIAVFAGDLVEKSLTWKLILETLEYRNYKMLKNLNGYFSIAALNKRENKLFVISDRRSQLPVFYLIDNMNICISTELSTFCRLPIEMSFNIEWLWEYLFFNFPVGQTTFLENVKRMPPASVLEIDIESGEYLFHEYATKFRKKKHLLEGKEALEYAYDVFRNRMPKYFTGANDIACALTGGWDGRTNLSFCPNINSVVAYTYGVPGCYDLVEASKTAQALNIKHRKILFDKNFEKELPSLVFDAVYLSSGLERITRSSLLYAYRNLTDCGKEFPLVISGISLDMQFRGHANVPAIISPDMTRIFSTGEKGFNENFWKECMGNCYEPFKRHILKQIDNLEKEYGKLSEPESHLSYILYEVSPKHFAGELAIAKHFTTLRIPAWDTDIVDLSYSIRNSTLSFSQFLVHQRGTVEEMILQAYLISQNGRALREIPVYGVPPKIFSKGKSIYSLARGYAYRIKYLIPKAIKIVVLRSIPPLEDWSKWLGGILKDTIGQLIFAENSRIKDYVSPEYINSLQNKVSNSFIGKLAATEIMPTSKLVTAEIILRLFLSSGRRGKG